MEFIFCFMLFTYDIDLIITGYVIFILSLPFWGVGTPFLIIGIIRSARANTRIAQINAMNNGFAPGQPPYTAPNQFGYRQ